MVDWKVAALFCRKKNKIVIYTLQKNFFLHRFLFPVLSANLVVAYFFTFGASIELSALWPRLEKFCVKCNAIWWCFNNQIKYVKKTHFCNLFMQFSLNFGFLCKIILETMYICKGPGRRGIVVIAYAYRTRDLGFESHQGEKVFIIV
jgi:hypothetical protein